jgi:hypothetical protein
VVLWDLSPINNGNIIGLQIKKYNRKLIIKNMMNFALHPFIGFSFKISATPRILLGGLCPSSALSKYGHKKSMIFCDHIRESV